MPGWYKTIWYKTYRKCKSWYIYYLLYTRYKNGHDTLHGIMDVAGECSDKGHNYYVYTLYVWHTVCDVTQYVTRGIIHSPDADIGMGNTAI